MEQIWRSLIAQAASYIDRVLKGKSADLPLQPPSRNDLVLKSQHRQGDGARPASQRAVAYGEVIA
jgi:hypothetical protein